MSAPQEDDEAFRARVVAEVPAGYSPTLHVAVPAAIGLGLAAVGASMLERVRWWEWLVVPIVWVASNATEWRAHKGLLHKRTPPLGALYDRHTPVHHRFFTEDRMAIRSSRELILVLLPAWGIGAIAAVVAPIAVGLWWLGQRNAAGLFLATTMLYVLSYEWLHLAYHLPPSSWVGRLALVRALGRHHARHHDPRLMRRWNFNVTVPLWDWVRGTIHRPGSAASSRV